jgi:hypothetical protein
LLKEEIKPERSELLRAAPDEQTDERTGNANASISKASPTRVGGVALRLPRVRGLRDCEPSAEFGQIGRMT